VLVASLVLVLVLEAVLELVLVLELVGHQHCSGRLCSEALHGIHELTGQAMAHGDGCVSRI
jgi:hypothetical protein